MNSPNSLPPSAPLGVPTTFDTGNTLIDERQGQLVTSKLQVPGQPPRVICTFHTETTTLTLFLAKSDALSWAAQIRNEAEGLSDSGLVIGRG